MGWYPNFLRPWCCCLAFKDRFNRNADTTDVNAHRAGSPWTERSGDWSVLEVAPAPDRKLVEAGNTGALVVHAEFKHSGVTTSSIEIQVELWYLDVGDKPRIVVNYLDDSNYYYAEVTVNNLNGDGTTLALYRRAAGVNNLLRTVTRDGEAFADPTVMRLCFKGVAGHDCGLEAEVVGITASNWPITPHANGNRAGLGNGANQDLVFDNFLAIELWWDDANCEYCICYCDDHIPNRTLTATFTGTGICSPIDGETITLTYQDTIGAWAGSGWLCEEGDTFSLQLHCSPTRSMDDVPLPELWIENGGGANECLPSNQLADSAQCDPIQFVWGPFTVDSLFPDCDCCGLPEYPDEGTITITITE